MRSRPCYKAAEGVYIEYPAATVRKWRLAARRKLRRNAEGTGRRKAL